MNSVELNLELSDRGAVGEARGERGGFLCLDMGMGGVIKVSTEFPAKSGNQCLDMTERLLKVT